MSQQSKVVRALRGATSVESNDAESILAGTEQLMRELLQRNSIQAGDLISCIFTVTDDLDAAFPAQAARQLGLNEVPLLCAREIPVPGAAPRIVRVLIHLHAGADAIAQHVYLGRASALREDLMGAQ